MSNMTLLEWVGLIIVLIVLLNFFQNDGYGWFDDWKSHDKQSVTKKTSE